MSETRKKKEKPSKSDQKSERNEQPRNSPPIPGVAPPEEPQVGDELPPNDRYARKYGSGES